MPELKNSLFEEITETPKEHYTFQLDPKSIRPIEKKYIGRTVRVMILAIIFAIAFFIYGTATKNLVVIGMAISYLIIAIIFPAKAISTTKKSYAKARERYETTVFDYTLYENYFIVWLSSDKSVRQVRYGLNEIRRAMIIADFVVMEIEGQIYIMKKNELIEDSFFLKICTKNKK